MREEVDAATQPPSMKREPRSMVMGDLLRCDATRLAPWRLLACVFTER
jgi:hypothetical protein